MTAYLSEEGLSIEEIVERRLMEDDINSGSHAQSELNVLRRINNLEKQLEELKNKIGVELTTVNDYLLNVTEFKPSNTDTDTTANNNTVSGSYSTTLNTESTTEAVKNSLTQFITIDITTKSNTVLQSDLNQNTDNVTLFDSDLYDNVTRNKQENYTANNTMQNRNDSDSEYNLASLEEDANNEVNMELNDAAINIQNKNDSSDKPDAPVESFPLLDESAKEDYTERVMEATDIIENDLNMTSAAIKIDQEGEFNKPEFRRYPGHNFRLPVDKI